MSTPRGLGRRRAAFVATLVSLIATGCATQDVVVATLDEREAGSTPGDGRCKSYYDCQPTEYCAKSDCAQETGGCQVRPLSCDDTEMESCGCDGVTYWNDCLRQRSGVAASSMGICSIGAAQCADPMGTDCPVLGASCARLLPPNAPCMPNVSGFCYVLAATCPMGGPPDTWTSCADPRICERTCDAIRSGMPHHRHLGPMCP